LIGYPEGLDHLANKRDERAAVGLAMSRIQVVPFNQEAS